MIIFGWGRKIKVMGETFLKPCVACNNTSVWQVIRQYRYFSLFFIPCIKYSSEYMHICPVCQRGDMLSGVDEARRLLAASLDVSTHEKASSGNLEEIYGIEEEALEPSSGHQEDFLGASDELEIPATFSYDGLSYDGEKQNVINNAAEVKPKNLELADESAIGVTDNKPDKALPLALFLAMAVIIVAVVLTIQGSA